MLNLQVGQTFHRLTILAALPRESGWQFYQCRCSCGKELAVAGTFLHRGLRKSCGCQQREVVGKLKYKHGGAAGERKSREYRSWSAIKTRCFNPKTRSYADYGGRGITMCPQWVASFETFLADVGRCPSPELLLDRIDNDKGYEPGNMRWTTRTVQNNNQRRPRQRISPHWRKLPNSDDYLLIFPRC